MFHCKGLKAYLLNSGCVNALTTEYDVQGQNTQHIYTHSFILSLPLFHNRSLMTTTLKIYLYYLIKGHVHVYTYSERHWRVSGIISNHIIFELKELYKKLDPWEVKELPGSCIVNGNMNTWSQDFLDQILFFPYLHFLNISFLSHKKTSL